MTPCVAHLTAIIALHLSLSLRPQAMDSAAQRGKLRGVKMAGAGTAVGAEDVLFLVRKVGSALCAQPAVVYSLSGACAVPGVGCTLQLRSCLLGRVLAPQALLHLRPCCTCCWRHR